MSHKGVDTPLTGKVLDSLVENMSDMTPQEQMVAYCDRLRSGEEDWPDIDGEPTGGPWCAPFGPEEECLFQRIEAKL